MWVGVWVGGTHMSEPLGMRKRECVVVMLGVACSAQCVRRPSKEEEGVLLILQYLDALLVFSIHGRMNTHVPRLNHLFSSLLKMDKLHLSKTCF